MAPGRLFEFGDFRLDPTERLLFRSNKYVPLPPKAVDMLLLLVERRGHVVDKDTLLKEIWPDTFVEEGNLTQNISVLRKILTEGRDGKELIETIPKRGYRFVAPVTEVNSNYAASAAVRNELPAPMEAGPGPPHLLPPDVLFIPSPTAHTGRSLRSRIAMVTTMALAAGLAVTAYLARQRFWPRPAGSPERIMLAVLPFQNLTGDPEQEYISDGLTEEMISQLGRLNPQQFGIIARTSAMTYKRTKKSVDQIARDLHVNFVLEGSLRRSGDRLRIAAQLIRASDQTHLWAHEYDPFLGDVVMAQAEVAEAIADQIQVKLTPQERTRMAGAGPVKPEAYEAFLRATYRLTTALTKNEDADAAIAQAEHAIALDPNFAEAYVALTWGCAMKIFSWQGGSEYDEKGFVALGKALALNPNLAEAYAARGDMYYTRLHNFDIARAVADYRRAISLNPNLAQARQSLGSELTHAGLHEKAIEEFRKGLRLDPQNDGLKFRLGRAFWQSQRFAEALETYERYDIVNYDKALTLGYLGRREQAWETIESVAQQLRKARRGSGGDSEDIAAVRAFLYATEDKPREAEREIQLTSHLGKDNDHFHHAAFILAAACAEMDKPREAVAWLKRVAEGGMPNYPLFHDNPSMRKLRGYPEYEQFMAQLKVRWDQLVISLQ